MYPNPDVAQFITTSFIPVRQHVKTHPGAMERFEVQWTPTLLVMDANGKERHRVEGFLDAGPLVAQLRLGLAQTAFASQKWDDAERLFEEVVSGGDADAAPEGAYWAGVARYKRSGDPNDLGATHKRLSETFADSAWAKKASVWG